MAISKNADELRWRVKGARAYLARVVSFLLEVLSSPKGSQGGWEGGARGL
jgi:hypothetical protein